MRGGKRPGAGRKKNAPNKASAARQAAVAASGQTPLDFLLEIMRAPIPPVLQTMLANGDTNVEGLAALVNWYDRRFEAAKAAAPYVHPRLANIEHSGEVSHRYVISAPEPTARVSEWEQRHRLQ